MAVTSIWSIKGWIGKVINYAENQDKTKEQTSQELISESETGQLQGLNDVITYAVNAEKTRLRQSKSTFSSNKFVACPSSLKMKILRCGMWMQKKCSIRQEQIPSL